MIRLKYTGQYGKTYNDWVYQNISEMRNSKQDWDFGQVAGGINFYEDENEKATSFFEKYEMPEWYKAFDDMDPQEFCDFWNSYSEDWCSPKGIVPVWRAEIE